MQRSETWSKDALPSTSLRSLHSLRCAQDDGLVCGNFNELKTLNTGSHIATETSTARQRRDVRILFAAGGTGGHVYPAISIADAIREQVPGASIRFVGTRHRMEWRAVPRAGYDIVNVWISGLHRRLTLKNLLFPLKLIVSLVQSFNIIKDFKPDIVVACGGFVSGPVGWVAAQLSIPLILQEQNSFPGLTNRLLAKHAQRIFTAFEQASQYLPEEKVTISGNPTRKSLTDVNQQKALNDFGFSDGRPVLLVLGGSGGARSINKAMEQNIRQLHDEMELQIIWQCGSAYYDAIIKKLNVHDMKRLQLHSYLDNMPEAYAAADLIVSRAGASSCSEIKVTGKPSIMIPSPNVAGNHQHKNAEAMVENGAAILVEDDEAPDRLAEVVNELIFDGDKLHQMSEAAKALARPDAAQTIATEILNLTKAQLN